MKRRHTALSRIRTEVSAALGVPAELLRQWPDPVLLNVAEGLTRIDPPQLLATVRGRAELVGLDGQERADRMFELCIEELARLGNRRGGEGSGGGAAGGAGGGGMTGTFSRGGGVSASPAKGHSVDIEVSVFSNWLVLNSEPANDTCALAA